MTGLNEPVLPYIKVRRQFGRQPRFVRDYFRIHVNIVTNRVIRKNFSRFRFVHKGVQACKQLAETPVNTSRRHKVSTGVCHTEGGWPKDINANEPDMTLRHRKKLEKEESYQVCLPIMFEKMERFVKQNNALDFYGDLFKEKWRHKDPNKKTPKAKTTLIYRDPSTYQRAVKKILWAPENTGKIIVCHTPFCFSHALRETPSGAYFWDVEIASRPESQIRSDSHIMDLNFHYKDTHSLSGAFFDGTVGHWDIRAGEYAISQTPLEISHTDICTGARWIASKTNTEFFSSGLDGQVIWWDCRNMKERLESVYLDPEKGNNRKEFAIPGTVLEYEPSVPTKFIVGGENGGLFLMMKKAKTPNDKLLHMYKGHRGPIFSVERNPYFVKNFLTVGDTTCKIFAEDFRESAIIWTAPKDVLYTHAKWLTSRPSNFVVTRNDGHYEIFDLVKDPARAFTVVKVITGLENNKTKAGKGQIIRELMQDTYLTYCSPSENPSKNIAIGSSKGNVYMQILSDTLYMSEKSDKPVLAQVFERETRREKMVEQRYREIRLRKKEKEKQVEIVEKIAKERAEFAEKALAEAKAEGRTITLPDYSKNEKYDIEFEARNNPICKAEREFYEEIEREITEKGFEAWLDIKDTLGESEKKKELEGDLGSALEITAADLAQFATIEEDEIEYDDDGRPIQKADKKEEEIPKAPTVKDVKGETSVPVAQSKTGKEVGKSEESPTSPKKHVTLKEPSET